jgi:hypothetical protein
MDARAVFLAGESEQGGGDPVPPRAITSDMKDLTWRASSLRWRRNPPVGFLRPCEPTLVDRPPAGPGWLHEVKHD